RSPRAPVGGRRPAEREASPLHALYRPMTLDANYAARGDARCRRRAKLASVIPKAAPYRIAVSGAAYAMTLDEGMQLSSGERLKPLTIAYETCGALNADRSNAVLVCHGLNEDQYVARPNPFTGRPGWWQRIVGPGRPLDTN